MNHLAERLKRARKASGLSLRSAGELALVSHSAIKKYEEGSVPSSDILLRLAKAYNVRMEYFFRPSSPHLEGVLFRKRKKLGKKKLAAIEHAILDQIERRLEIEDLCPGRVVEPFSVPKNVSLQIDSLDQIEDIANAVREEWNLGLAPLTNFVDLLEEKGVRIFFNDLDDPSFDGLTGTVGNGIPIIVVGSSWPGDRQRFTLAHELGHLIVAGRLSDDIDEEMAANRFAGAFLFPGSAVIQEFGKVRTSFETREFLLVKEEYGISMSAQAFRLKDLEVIPEVFFKQFMISLRKKGWSKNEPGKPFPSEKVHVFEHMVFFALSENIIGESKAAELLNTPIENFRNYRTAANENAVAC